jgi:NitT/TauT family transport system substrate-binding protein
MTGASVVFAARREMADSNPKLMEAMYAAFRDAATWFNDPANFEELVKIYTPLISFGDMPGADQLRRDWIKSVIPAYSRDLHIDRAAVKAILDFYVENKMLEKTVDPAKLVWSKAP